MYPAPDQIRISPIPMNIAIYAATRVFVVIENVVILLDIEDTLRQLGVGLIRATSSVPHALASLPDWSFDIAVVDVRDTSSEGQRLLSELEQRLIPVIQVGSAASLVSGRRNAHERHTVSIPFDTAAIAAALERALGRS